MCVSGGKDKRETEEREHRGEIPRGCFHEHTDLLVTLSLNKTQDDHTIHNNIRVTEEDKNTPEYVYFYKVGTKSSLYVFMFYRGLR